MDKGQVATITLYLTAHYSFRTEQSGNESKHEMVSEGKYRKDTAKQPIVLLIIQHY
jgi:hypothetical protein